MAQQKMNKGIYSMTGFGRGQAEIGDVSVLVELKSTNGKGFHCKLRMPPSFLELELKVENILRKKIIRGSINAVVQISYPKSEFSEINLSALQKYLKSWHSSEKALNLKPSNPSIRDLISMPGALSSPKIPSKKNLGIEKALKLALSAAVDGLLLSRAKEGKRLGTELARLVKHLEKYLVKVDKRSPVVLRALHLKNQKKVDTLLEGSKESEKFQLAYDLIGLVDKGDIQEEIARLKIHIKRLQSLLDSSGDIGREYEFVLQECHREITTLGNKSFDAQLSSHVIAMKKLVQQMKEQVANIE